MHKLTVPPSVSSCLTDHQITDSSVCVTPLASKRVRTRRRSPSNLPRPSTKWSPYLRIVTPGPSAYRRVCWLPTLRNVFPILCRSDNGSQVGSKICCVLPVTTLRQRLLQPDFQPAGASQLHPRHKHLLMKRSLRCRVSAPSSVLRSLFNQTLLFFQCRCTLW